MSHPLQQGLKCTQMSGFFFFPLSQIHKIMEKGEVGGRILFAALVNA